MSGRQVADLVEEDRASVRDLEAADAALEGARERTALVAEELALDERAGERGAVDRDERTVAAGAARVDRARDELLAGPGLAREEDGRPRRRDLLDEVEHVAEGRAPSDDLAEAVDAAGVIAEHDVLGLGALLEAGDLLETRAELALLAVAHDRAREDLAEEAKPREELGRPIARRRQGGEGDQADRGLPDPQREHEVRLHADGADELSFCGPRLRNVLGAPHREAGPRRAWFAQAGTKNSSRPFVMGGTPSRANTTVAFSAPSGSNSARPPRSASKKRTSSLDRGLQLGAEEFRRRGEEPGRQPGQHRLEGERSLDASAVTAAFMATFHQRWRHFALMQIPHPGRSNRHARMPKIENWKFLGDRSPQKGGPR